MQRGQCGIIYHPWRHVAQSATRGPHVPAVERSAPTHVLSALWRDSACMCESETSPDWLWLARGHLMHCVNTGTLRTKPRLNHPPTGAGWVRPHVQKRLLVSDRFYILRLKVNSRGATGSPIREELTIMQMRRYRIHVSSSSSRAAASWSPAGAQLTTRSQVRPKNTHCTSTAGVSLWRSFQVRSHTSSSVCFFVVVLYLVSLGDVSGLERFRSIQARSCQNRVQPARRASAV